VLEFCDHSAKLLQKERPFLSLYPVNRRLKNVFIYVKRIDGTPRNYAKLRRIQRIIFLLSRDIFTTVLLKNQVIFLKKSYNERHNPKQKLSGMKIEGNKAFLFITYHHFIVRTGNGIGFFDGVNAFVFVAHKFAVFIDFNATVR